MLLLRRAFATAATKAPSSSARPLAAAAASPSTPAPEPDTFPEWKPAFAVPEQCHSIFTLPHISSFTTKNSMTNSSQAVSKPLAPTALLANLVDTVMLRQSWLSLVDLINAEMKKPESKDKIFLDSRAGSGKSTFLNLAASHYKAFGYIVLHFPNVQSWISGLEPYAKPEGSPYFTQSSFTSVVLKQILDVNSAVLDKITVKGAYTFGTTPFSGTLSQLLTVGIENTTESHKVLESFMNELLEFPENRPPVLFSFDQVNAFYGKTAYFDTESKPILADQMALMRPFINLMSRPSIPKATLLAATDQTTTQIKSPFLNHHLTNPTAAPPTPTDLSQFSTFGNALVNKSIAPALYDPFTFKNNVHPVGVKVFAVPALSVGEAYSLVEGLRKKGLVGVGKVGDEFVQKTVMVTKGNARDVLKYCV
ncbi:37S ribosomal protein S23 mitochondrial [Podochytrium sp. JEL0797]|nr:37S ribosomal protein S23 mitochondrial [Podochytrium sp. JEL0797]